jgi:hypothetical protein
MSTTILQIRKDHLPTTRWHERADEPLAPGQVRVRIDRFALTSNNITYAAFGEAMNYWRFYPSGEEGWGVIPVWGFATVVESTHPDVPVGERVYGYFPMASHTVLTPVRVSAGGWADGAPHRAELHPVYNQLTRCATDPFYTPDTEDVQALLRPLFITSWLIDDFLADNDFFGARVLLLSSASSKTAYGTAFCLARRRGQAGAPRVLGLTSQANLDFTRALGCYDAVIAYDDLAALDRTTRAVYVDFSGSAALRRAIHEGFGDRLAYSCSVGGTHWDELAAKGASRELPGPKPTLFFAPAQASKRIEQWGAAGLQQRLAEAWVAFMQPVTSAQPPWLRVVEHHGPQAAEAVYRALLDGTAAPQDGHIVSLAA